MLALLCHHNILGTLQLYIAANRGLPQGNT